MQPHNPVDVTHLAGRLQLTELGIRFCIGQAGATIRHVLVDFSDSSIALSSATRLNSIVDVIHRDAVLDGITNRIIDWIDILTAELLQLTILL